MIEKGVKRGQVTIFIIIAVLIIGIVALVYFLLPKANTGTTFDTKNPQAFMQSCLKDSFSSLVKNISLHGGSLSPEFYSLYQGERVEYLCYTNENFKNECVIQQPLLIQHIESEIKKGIAPDVDSCFTNLQENYKADGYAVEPTNGIVNVSLLPGKIMLNLTDYALTVSKSETSRYDAFSVALNNNLYELAVIANNMVDWESVNGNAPVNMYMSSRQVWIDRSDQEDGTKIYIITDQNTGDKFQFASRSGVMVSPV